MTFAARSTRPPVHPCNHPSFRWRLAAALAAALAALEANNGVNAKIEVLVRIESMELEKGRYKPVTCLLLALHETVSDQ